MQKHTKNRKQKDAHLLVRMITVLVSMLKKMKDKTFGPRYTIEIANANKTNGLGEKGFTTTITFHKSLTTRIRSFSQAAMNAAVGTLVGNRRQRRASTISTPEPAPAGAVDWDKVPFAAFIRRQVERILQAPKHVCQVGERAGESFFGIVFREGSLQITLKSWALPTEMKAKSGKTYRGNQFWHSRNFKGVQPFFQLSPKEMKMLLQEAGGTKYTTVTEIGQPDFKTMTAEKKEKFKGKTDKNRSGKLSTYNAALAMATILFYTLGNQRMKDNWPVALYVDGRPSKFAKVLGKVTMKTVNGNTRLNVESVKTRVQYRAPYEEDRDRKVWVKVSGRSNNLSGYRLIRLVQEKLNDDTIEFGKKSSARKAIMAHFAKPPHKLTEGNKRDFSSRPTTQTAEYIFKQTICGGKDKTIAKQLRISESTVSDETLGDTLMGSDQGLFMKMLFSMTAFSTNAESEKIQQERMGSGALDPAYENGVKTIARRGKEGWTQRGLLSQDINWKTAAMNLANPIFDWDLAEMPADLKGTEDGEEHNLILGMFDELIALVGAANYRPPVLLQADSLDAVPTHISSRDNLIGDPSQDAEQMSLLERISARMDDPRDFKPFCMFMDEWNARSGLSFGANLISKPYDSSEGDSMGVEFDDNGAPTGEVSFVELVAYPTHTKWLDEVSEKPSE